LAYDVSTVPVLEARRLSKNYGGLKAVDDISFAVSAGEILGIVGPNGAGKTSLFDVISGHTRASGGDVLLDGVSVISSPVHARSRRGIARTFQQPIVAGSLSVFENMLLATSFSKLKARGGPSPLDTARAQLSFIGLDNSAERLAGTLGVFDKKRLMLGTALATGARALLLDEPFGGLSFGEIELTMDLIRRSRSDDLVVICIEHVMRALTLLVDRVLVMHHGAELFAGTPEQMLRDDRVIEVYLGSKHRRSRENEARQEPQPTGTL
jgi:branched-chain amino acid transport system ATP-binding protein